MPPVCPGWGWLLRNGQAGARTQHHGPVDMAGGLRLVAIARHNVNEVLVEGCSRNLPFCRTKSFVCKIEEGIKTNIVKM